MLLFARNVFDALLMTSTSKLCIEEFVEALTANFFGDEATREDNHVGIVVLTNEVGDLWLPNKTCTNALVLVEGHGDAFAGAAHGDATFYLTCFDAFSQLVAIGGIVAAVFGVGAVVFVFNALFLQVALDELLERKSGMIGC